MKKNQQSAYNLKLAKFILKILHETGYLTIEQHKALTEQQLNQFADSLAKNEASTEILTEFAIKVTADKLQTVINMAKQMIELEPAPEIIHMPAAENLIKALYEMKVIDNVHMDIISNNQELLNKIEGKLKLEKMERLGIVLMQVSSLLRESMAQNTCLQGEVTILLLEDKSKVAIERNGYYLAPDFIKEKTINPVISSIEDDFILYHNDQKELLATLELIGNGMIMRANLQNHNIALLIPRVDQYLMPISNAYDLIMETKEAVQYITQANNGIDNSQIAHRDSRASRFYASLNNVETNTVIDVKDISEKVILPITIPDHIMKAVQLKPISPSSIQPKLSATQKDKVANASLKGSLIFMYLDQDRRDLLAENKFNLSKELIISSMFNPAFISKNNLSTTYTDKNYKPLSTITLLANSSIMSAKLFDDNIVILVPRIDKNMKPVTGLYDIIIIINKELKYIKHADDMVSHTQITPRDSRVESLVTEAITTLFPNINFC